VSFGLEVREAGRALVGAARLDHRHEGARGAAHGGALAALLDELLGDLTSHIGQPAVTASLTVDFRAPIKLPRTIELRAWCERVEGRKLFLRGEIRDGQIVAAEAHGLWIQTDGAFSDSR
jgi:acyl-coenzyme A thioesterase PaaI-like protein